MKRREGEEDEDASPRTLAAVVATAERDAIEQALTATAGNRERAAEMLSVSPTTLWRKMNRLRIEFE